MSAYLNIQTDQKQDQQKENGNYTKEHAKNGVLLYNLYWQRSTPRLETFFSVSEITLRNNMFSARTARKTSQIPNLGENENSLARPYLKNAIDSQAREFHAHQPGS